jgi:hypothetical protein
MAMIHASFSVPVVLDDFEIMSKGASQIKA